MYGHKYREGDIVQVNIDGCITIGTIEELVPMTNDYLLREDKSPTRTYISEFEITEIIEPSSNKNKIVVDIPKSLMYYVSEKEVNGDLYLVKISKITGKTV